MSVGSEIIQQGVVFEIDLRRTLFACDVPVVDRLCDLSEAVTNHCRPTGIDPARRQALELSEELSSLIELPNLS